MDFKFPYRNSLNPRDLIRRAGYGEWHDEEFNTISYTRKLDRGHYPRFHVYLKEESNYFEVSLHLDQKQPSYGTSHAHSADYDGPQVTSEAQRITASIKESYGL